MSEVAAGRVGRETTWAKGKNVWPDGRGGRCQGGWTIGCRYPSKPPPLPPRGTSAIFSLSSVSMSTRAVETNDTPSYSFSPLSLFLRFFVVVFVFFFFVYFFLHVRLLFGDHRLPAVSPRRDDTKWERNRTRGAEKGGKESKGAVRGQSTDASVFAFLSSMLLRRPTAPWRKAKAATSLFFFFFLRLFAPTTTAFSSRFFLPLPSLTTPFIQCVLFPSRPHPPRGRRPTAASPPRLGRVHRHVLGVPHVHPRW